MWTIFCFLFKKKTSYELRISGWSSDVCSSDLPLGNEGVVRFAARDTLAAFGGAQFGRCVDIDDQIDLVIDDLVDVVRVLVRHQVLAQILHHQLRITFEYVAVTAAGTLADHVDLAFVADQIGRASCRERACQYV